MRKFKEYHEKLMEDIKKIRNLYALTSGKICLQSHLVNVNLLMVFNVDVHQKPIKKMALWGCVINASN